MVGTPEYLSLEQATLENVDVDTRSDVYSLGVQLYVLLTGTTPVTRERVREAALLEVLRVVREEDLPRPSTRISAAGTRASIAAVRGTEPGRLRLVGYTHEKTVRPEPLGTAEAGAARLQVQIDVVRRP